jgi:hypothetical protein
MTKTKKTIFSLLAFVMMALPMVMATQSAQAQFDPDATRGRELGVTQTGRTNFIEVLFTVIKGLLAVVFAIAVLMFVISGIYFITAAGTDRADTARDILTYAIIGLVVSVLGYAIVLFLGNVLTGGSTNGGAGGGISITTR